MIYHTIPCYIILYHAITSRRLMLPTLLRPFGRVGPRFQSTAAAAKGPGGATPEARETFVRRNSQSVGAFMRASAKLILSELLRVSQIFSLALLILSFLLKEKL